MMTPYPTLAPCRGRLSRPRKLRSPALSSRPRSLPSLPVLLRPPRPHTRAQRPGAPTATCTWSPGHQDQRGCRPVWSYVVLCMLRLRRHDRPGSRHGALVDTHHALWHGEVATTSTMQKYYTCVDIHRALWPWGRRTRFRMHVHGSRVGGRAGHGHVIRWLCV